jgi:16S rRNA (cytidine1402-2'-O)-methyltransferase
VNTEKSGSGKLFIVGTPLGNLEDISLRALRVLKEADLIAAEDTRVTRKLLSHYAIPTPLIAFHQHSSTNRLQQIIGELKGGKNIALVTDAGMPGISDPGEELAAACIAAGIALEPIPGPSALITALAVSGLPTKEFIFVGFLSRQKGERKNQLQELSTQPRTLIFYEAPHRLTATLKAMLEVLGDRRAVVGRELTKKFEEVLRGRTEEIIAHFAANAPRGEFTLVVAGAEVRKEDPSSQEITDEILAGARALITKGSSVKEAAREIAGARGVSRRLLYNALQKNVPGKDR